MESIPVKAIGQYIHMRDTLLCKQEFYFEDTLWGWTGTKSPQKKASDEIVCQQEAP